MKKQAGHGRLSAILLTFSVLLLVLALGFVVGRVVIARAYLSSAPRFEMDRADAAPQIEEPRRASPGSVYVPPPAVPREEERELQEVQEGEGRREGVDDTVIREEARERESQRETPEREESPEPQPPRPTTVPPTAPRTEPAEAEGSYSIQVGLFTSLSGARQLVEDLARAKYSARIAPQQRGDQQIYRVLVGNYRSEYAARRAVEHLRLEGFEAFLITE